MLKLAGGTLAESLGFRDVATSCDMPMTAYTWTMVLPAQCSRA